MDCRIKLSLILHSALITEIHLVVGSYSTVRMKTHEKRLLLLQVIVCGHIMVYCELN